ncbi:MAG: alanine--tRNA ligase [Nitrososphaerota archaeon]
MRFGEEHYSLDFLKDKGFVRARCRVCGEFFWSVDKDREVCGEAPCEAYSFIGKPPTTKKYTLEEMRDSFLGFFERNGHEVIEPYPVVPRWRRDLYLVSASIVDFQPHVTSGAVEPPANPLVISQPCIRLVDIDKVGLTFGRHLTIFEMGGAHAFNTAQRKVYWKDTTVALCHKFLSELGLRDEQVVYKEGVWSGGGNAGPCFEVIVGGLEIATLVFMSYRTLDGELIELPVRTVDTGYGMERFTWLSVGTPSSFEAIYQGIASRISKYIDAPKIDRDILEKYSRFSAWITPSSASSLREVREKAAQLAGISIAEILPDLERLEKYYALLDHTKSIIFILSEGVVPSNSKVGYLARLLIRKSQRLLKQLGAEEHLVQIAEEQLNYWGRWFPKLLEMREEVLELIEHEVSKFSDTVNRGLAHLERELMAIKSSGAAISTDFLVRMYDEKGLTPDIVSEAASKIGLPVSIPGNIHELVAEMHGAANPQEEQVDERLVVVERQLKDVPPTKKKYYEYPYEGKFESRVLSVGDNYVVLEETLFYAEGGGQVGDVGLIHHSNGTCRVIDTQPINSVIVHFVDGPLPNVGETVKCEVDIERRLSIMRHHTATHILIGALRRVLGKHAWQMGAKKEADYARLDISHYKSLTMEEIEKIEQVANSVVARRLPVEVKWMSKSEAERKFGFTIYQGGEAPLGMLRLIIIPDWDAEACGGLHCQNTAEVGLIKILGVDKIQDGVIRLTFAAGPAALSHIQSKLRDYHEKYRKTDEELSRLRLLAGKILEDAPKEINKSIASLTSKVGSEVVESHSEVFYKPIARLWLSLKSYQKEEVIKGIRLIFDVSSISDELYLRTLAISISILSEPTAILLIGRGKERNIVALYVNNQCEKRGASLEKLASRLENEANISWAKKDNAYIGYTTFRDFGKMFSTIKSFLESLSS